MMTEKIRKETLQAFIFDLDGTLLDTLGDLAASVNYALKACDMPQHSIDDVRRFVGNGVRLLMERAVPEGAANPRFEEAFTTFRQHYMQHSLDTTRPYDGIMEMLQALRSRGFRTAVVSNKFYAATQELCQHFFADSMLGVSREQAVYVGDSDVDIATAVASGMPCISVLWGFRDREFLLAHGATQFISHPSELLTLFE